MRRSPGAAIAALVTSLATATALAPAADAVSRGTADEGRHPMVGTMVAQDSEGEPLWSCSGTLISPTVFVTAGHCTSDDDGTVAPHVQVWFDGGPIATDEDFLADPAGLWCEDDATGTRYSGYPCTGEHTGTAHTVPGYDPDRFWLRDLGVVVLDEAVTIDQYAVLPAVGAFDGWRPNHKQAFTAVGYGKQFDYGQGSSRDEGPVERRVSHPRLGSVNSPSVGDYALRLSGNARTGGTCSGDSGGPNLLEGTLVIAGVTSTGSNDQTCSGSDGAYRLDRDEDRAWLMSFLS